MNTIQSGMLIGLGFLAATLLGLLLAPAFWRRAVRLTSKRIKDSMPLSEMEIEADRDRIRAEYAIKMHKLETLVEQVRLAAARQQIEINRRDARVNSLESDLERLRASYEEAQNARRVLEQTLADRLPRVETRLTDAKKLLHAREREVGEITRTAERQAKALAEASSINAQQQRELERLGNTVSSRGSRRDAATDSALRSELEALRAKTREQAQVLARMQSTASDALGAAAAMPSATEVDLERQLRNVRARNDEQAAEIARLKATIAAFENETASDGRTPARESRLALRARLQSLEDQSSQQNDVITKLRNEQAASRELQADQAAQFAGELRRLTPAASAPASDRGPRPEIPARSSLAERVAQARVAAANSGAESERAIEQTLDAEMAAATAANFAPADNDVAAHDGAASGHARRDAELSKQASEPLPASARPAARPRLLDRIAGLSRGS